MPKLVGMKLEDINPDDYPELKIDLNGVTYDYNDEYEKGYVYEQTPKAGEMVKGGRVRTISLKVSLGKENNLMPDLAGQSEANAMSQLKAMNLGLNVRREEESSDTVPAGSVTRTDPAAETELQEGQSVTVYVSLGSGKMPELKNQSKENAKSILDAMNLNLRITYLEEESDDIASGNVTRTVPASDSQLSRGQQVTVYVSKGSGKVTVPPVTGLSVRDAIDLLTENGLKYEIKRVYSDTDEKDRVVRQSEAANSKVAKDTIVTLEVSDGPAPTEAPTEAPLMLVRVLFCTDGEISEITIQDEAGQELQRLIPGRDGSAVSARLEPGRYRAVTTLGEAVFTLLPNASVRAESGPCWSDGEQLHLTAVPVGSVLVQRSLAAGEQGCLEFTLTDNDSFERRAVVYPDGAGNARCSLFGVPLGTTYALLENGVQRATVTLTADEPEQLVRLAP